ncbi:MAG: HAMP domain-containing protein [Defluviitaleaceae bacterium]|nr:HAMP domain-containing protein [Defluviitaleaceae bacterium]
MVNKKNSLRLSQKLVLGIVIFSVIGLVLAFIIVNTVVRNIVYDNIIGTIQRDKIIYTEQIDAWFSMSHTIIDSLSRALLSVGLDQINALESGLVDEYTFLDGAYIGFSDGSFAGFRGWIPGEEWDSTTRPWYYEAIAVPPGTSITTEPYVSRATGGLVTAISRNMGIVDGLNAVVAIDIHLDYILEKIAEFEIAGGGYLFMIDASGQIIIHPDPRFLPTLEGLQNIYNISGYTELFRRFTAGEELIRKLDQYGVSSYFMQFPLHSTGWTLIAVIPTVVTSVPVWQILSTIMLTIVLVLTMMTVFTCIFLSYKFVKPLKKLTKSANEVAKGKLDINHDYSSDDEIGQVFGAFEEIVKSLSILAKNIQKGTEANKHGDILYQFEDYRLEGTYAELLKMVNTLTHEFALTIDCLSDPFIYVDKDFKILYANNIMQEYADVKGKDIIGMHINNLVNGDIAGHFATIKAFKEATPQDGGELQLQLNPKQLFDFEYTCIPTAYKGKVVCALILLTNVTRVRDIQRGIEKRSAYRTYRTEKLTNTLVTAFEKGNLAVNITKSSYDELTVYAKTNDKL